MFYKSSLLAIGVAATGAIGFGVFGGAIGLSGRTVAAEPFQLAQANCPAFSQSSTNNKAPSDPAWGTQNRLGILELNQNKGGHSKPVSSVAFSPDGSFLASGSEDRTVKIWNLRTGKPQHILAGSKFEIAAVTFSPNGRYLADISIRDGLVRLWDWKREIQLSNSAKLLRGASVTFSPNSQVLAASGVGPQPVKLWSVADGYLDEISTKQPVPEKQAIDSIAFSPDGKTIASAGKETPTIKLWNARTGQSVCVLGQHDRNVTSVAFSADGRFLASASADNTIKLWSLQSMTLLSTLKGHTGRVTSLAFSPSGEVLVSASRDKMIRLWRIRTSEIILSVNRNSSDVTSVAFRSDGRAFAAGSADTTVQVFTYISQ